MLVNRFCSSLFITTLYSTKLIFNFVLSKKLFFFKFSDALLSFVLIRKYLNYVLNN